MFSDVGFPLTSDQRVSDELVDAFAVSGNETTVAAQFTDLLASVLDELMASIVPMTCAFPVLLFVSHDFMTG